MPSMLNPKVITTQINFLTQKGLNQLLRSLKSKKFGTTIHAVDVEEITVTHAFTLQGRYIGDYRRILCGNYFNVKVEYVIA